MTPVALKPTRILAFDFGSKWITFSWAMKRFYNINSKIKLSLINRAISVQYQTTIEDWDYMKFDQSERKKQIFLYPD